MKRFETYVYSSIILSLIIGIVVLSIIFSVVKPTKEGFTELYFYDVPQGQVEKDFNFSFSIANNEKQDYLYNVSIRMEGDGNVYPLKNFRQTIATDDIKNYTIIVPEKAFSSARVVVQIAGKSDIYFWVTKKEQYATDCVKDTLHAENVVIQARGRLDPRMKVYSNGKLVFSLTLPNLYQNYTIYNVTTGYLDIVYDNDVSAGTNDRNLYIKSVNGKKTFTYDQGLGEQALDCRNVINITTTLPYNGAVRFKII